MPRTPAQVMFVATAVTIAFHTATQGIEIDMPLHVRDTSGVERKGEICSTGVPLPAGAMKDAGGLAVHDPQGKPVPAQFRVLERWRDRAAGMNDLSVKWLLVTFLADVPAGGKTTYRLKPGPNPVPGSPVHIEESGDSFKMGRTLFKKNMSAPFRPVLTLPDGNRLPASALKTLKWSVWEEGPVRACLAGESQTEDGAYGIMVWIYAYSSSTGSEQASRPRWDMTLLLKNTPNKARGPLYFKDFSVSWRPAGLDNAGAARLGGEWGKAVTADVNKTAYLYQDSDGTETWKTMSRRRQDWRTGKYKGSHPWSHAYVLGYAQGTVNGKKQKLAPLGEPAFRGYKVLADDKESGTGNHAQGWMSLHDGKRTALLLVRDFLRQYPKAVEAQPGRLIARLWPKYWQAQGGLHWLDDLQRKAHDLSFRIIDGVADATACENAARTFDHPLVIHCGTDWYRKTGVYGYLSPRFKESEVKVEPRLLSNGSTWVTHGGDLLDRIRRRYHDAPMGPFIRHGNPGSARRVYVAMQHSSGMTPMWPDDYRYPRDATMLKIGYCSPARGAGGKYNAGTAHHGYMPWNNQHWLCDEISDSWRLFGDPLAYDALRDMATYIRFYFDRRNSGKERIGETRVDALPMVVMADCHRLLEDDALLAALRDFVRTTCRRQINKQRGYYQPNRNVSRESGGADKPFMLSTLMDGLREYWYLSRDEVAFDLMLGITDYCIEEGFINEILGFRYTIPVDLKTSRETLAAEKAKKDPHRGGYRAWQMFRPLAFAYLYTGDELYRDTFRKMCKAAKDATVWRHKGSPNPDSSDWGYICDRVRDLPEQKKPDADPPAAIADLAAEAVGGGKVKLTWTTPADAAYLRIKWADKPMVRRLNLPEQADTHANWWAAENVSNEPEARPGKQSLVVDGIPAGVRHFAVRAFDAADNRGPLGKQATVRVR